MKKGGSITAGRHIELGSTGRFEAHRTGGTSCIGSGTRSSLGGGNANAGQRCGKDVLVTLGPEGEY